MFVEQINIKFQVTGNPVVVELELIETIDKSSNGMTAFILKIYKKSLKETISI